MKTVLMTLLALSYVGLSHADEYIKCDGATVNFDFESQIQYVNVIMTISRGDIKTILIYGDEIHYIGAECRANNKGKKYIVFQAYCGGSACHTGDNFGIIDPIDLRVLLVPNDWNSKDAKRIFGSNVRLMHTVLSVGDHGKPILLDK